MYLSIFPEVLRLIFPAEMCDPLHTDYDADTAAKFQTYLQLWTEYKAIWVLLNNTSMATKEAKADKLQELVDPWMTLFKSKFPQTRYLYPHILQSHMADFIRRMPVDPVYLQTQGLEHRHKKRKKIHNSVTNFRGPAKEGEQAKSRARTPQALSAVLVGDELGSTTYHVGRAGKSKRKEERVIEKRAQAKIQRVAEIEKSVAAKVAELERGVAAKML